MILPGPGARLIYAPRVNGGPRWLPAALLAALLFAIGLATSRLGLVGHELVGHGGPVVASGGRVVAVELFYFAGGWIRYRLVEPSFGELVLVATGGIAVEALVGLVLWGGLYRRPSMAARLARAVGAALVIHAAWYLAIGTWHGFGDGRFLRREFDAPVRLVIAIGSSAVAVGIAYLGARAIFGTLLATLPGRGAARIATLTAVLVVAGGVQALLAVGEVQLRRDETYGTIMQPEQQRVVERELAQWQAQQGPAVDERVVVMRRRELEAQHRDWPLKYVLGGLVALAVIAGCLRSPVREPEAIAPRLLARAWLLAAGSLALVIVLDAVLGV